MVRHLPTCDTDSFSNEQDRRAGGLLSEVIRRLCVVRSEGDPQPAQVMQKRISMRNIPAPLQHQARIGFAAVTGATGL